MEDTGKKLAMKYFTKEKDGSNVWICNCGVRRTVNGMGFSNLVSHIKQVHLSSVSTSKIEIDFNTKTGKIYSWLRMVTIGLLPFSSVSNEKLLPFVCMEKITYNSFTKYMHKLTKIVEEKIRNILPDEFCLIFDGWTKQTTHFIAVFATFSSSNELGYDSVLLGFGPFENETSLGTSELYKYLSFTLSIYKKTWDNVTAVVGDNCSVNKSLANRLTCGFIGCSSHRFNLAVLDIIKSDEELIQKVNCIMKKFKNLLHAAKLREYSHLRAVTKNDTRWSSTFNMISRYFELSNAFCEIGKHDVEVKLLRLTKTEEKNLSLLFKKLESLNQVTLALQNPKTTISTVQYIFEEVIKEFPSTCTRLSPTASIVHDKWFESGIAKIQEGRSAALNIMESTAVHKFKKNNLGKVSFDDNESIVVRACKQQKLDLTAVHASYKDVRYILPTSNMCERFFSIAGHTVSSRRQNILPSNLESQLFLAINQSMWNIADVSTILYDCDN